MYELAPLFLLSHLVGVQAQSGSALCANDNQYDGSAQMSGTSCADMVSYTQTMLTFPVDAATCSSTIQFGDSPMVVGVWFATLAQSCCGDRISVCGASAPNICANQNDWHPSGIVPNDNPDEAGTPCSLFAYMVGDLGQADSTTCSEMITMGSADSGATPTVRGVMMEYLSTHCCNGQNSKCAINMNNICADPSQFDKNATVLSTDHESGHESSTPCVMAYMYSIQGSASAESCAVSVNTGDSTPTTRAIGMANMATACCRGTPSVCSNYQVNPCADPSHFEPTNQAQGNSCGVLAAMLPQQVNEQTCAATMLVGDEHMSAASFLAHTSQCCGGQPSVCSQYDAQICASPDAFQPEASQNGTMCKEISAYLIGFTANATSCGRFDHQAGNSIGAVLAQYGATCCSGSATVCDNFVTNPCADPADFMPDTLAAQLGNQTCKQAMMNIPLFAPSRRTCTEPITVFDNTQTRRWMMDYISPMCCRSGAISICDPSHLDILRPKTCVTLDAQQAANLNAVPCSEA